MSSSWLPFVLIIIWWCYLCRKLLPYANVVVGNEDEFRALAALGSASIVDVARQIASVDYISSPHQQNRCHLLDFHQQGFLFLLTTFILLAENNKMMVKCSTPRRWWLGLETIRWAFGRRHVRIFANRMRNEFRILDISVWSVEAPRRQGHNRSRRCFSCWFSHWNSIWSFAEQLRFNGSRNCSQSHHSDRLPPSSTLGGNSTRLETLRRRLFRIQRNYYSLL